MRKERTVAPPSPSCRIVTTPPREPATIPLFAAIAAAARPPPPSPAPLLTQHASRWRCECALAGGESVPDGLLLC
jgi:hypothetical protein